MLEFLDVVISLVLIYSIYIDLKRNQYLSERIDDLENIIFGDEDEFVQDQTINNDV